jgi:hypothetical protein
MERYFFDIGCPNQEKHKDEFGTRLTSDVAARTLAQRIIRELREAGGYDEPGFTMTVRDAGGRTVFSMPFCRGPESLH